MIKTHERDERTLYLALYFGTLALSLTSILSFKWFLPLPVISAIAATLIFGFAISYFRLSENYPFIKYLINGLLIAVFIFALKGILFDKKDVNLILCRTLLWVLSLYSLSISKDKDYILMRWMSGIGIIVSSTLGGSLASMRYYSITMIAIAFLILVILFRVDFIREHLRYLSLAYEERGFEKKRLGGLLSGSSFTSFCVATFLLAYFLVPRAEHVIYKVIPQDLAKDPKKIIGQQDLEKTSGYLYIKPSQLTIRIGNAYNIRAFYVYGAEKDKKREVTNLVEWSVEDLKVAHVSKGGILKGAGPGATKIRCVYRMVYGILTSGPIEVFVGLSSIELKPAFGTVSISKTLKIEPIGIFEDGSAMDLTDKVWWELNKNLKERAIASILNNGILIAHRDGLVELRAIKGREGEGEVVESPISYIVIKKPYAPIWQKGDNAGRKDAIFSSSHPGYWRSVVYDQYNGGNWSVSQQALSDLEKEDNKFYSTIAPTSSSETKKVKINCLINQDMPGIIPQFGRGAQEIIFHEMNKGAVKSDFNDNFYLLPEFVLPNGLSFDELVSLERELPSLDFTVSDFKSYPHFIMKNYTQLPDGFSQKISEKTKEVVGDKASVRDIVEAIDDYIFRTCVVNPQRDAPEEPGDIVEYALFSGGACTAQHLASAQVVMYRLAGIPARLIAGFASFSQNSASGRYDVYESSNTAWPQVYIKNYGWVDRFPDRLYREEVSGLKQEPAETRKEEGALPIIKANPPKNASGDGRIIALLAPFLFIVFFLYIKKKAFERMMKLYPKEAIIELYKRFIVRMKSFDYAFDKTLTPHEVSELVAKKNPALRGIMTRLTTNYLEAGYSSYAIGPSKACESLKALGEIERYLFKGARFFTKVRAKILYPWIALKGARGIIERRKR